MRKLLAFLIAATILLLPVQADAQSMGATVIVQGGNTANVTANNNLQVELHNGASTISITGTSLNVNCTAGCSAAGDTVGSSSSLAALNNTATVALAGENGAVVIFTGASSPVLTVVAEVSPDGGTTWFSAVFLDPVAGTTSTSLVNPANGQWQIGYVGAASNARVRVSAFTSGSITAQLRSTVTRPYVISLGTDGTNIRALSTTATGILHTNANQWGGTALGAPTNFGSTPGAVIAGSVNSSLFLGTTAAVTAASGVQKVGVVGNAGAAFDAATGAAPPANALLVAGLGSGATGGFMTAIPVSDTYKAINISTATTTLIVTGVSGRQVRIGAYELIAAGADNVAWIEGTGATCGTGTAGMAGGTTAASGYNFAANGGIARGSGLGTILSTVTAGDSVCLVTSAAVQLSGGLSYTIF